jgi:NAD(P)H dehydrogenase (quinone)
MQKPTILVTSAAGRTGSVAVYELLKKGYPVRAFVRSDDARAEKLRSAGAEIYVGNLFDYRDLTASMIGVQRAYHCPPFAPNLLHNAMLFALAAEEAKLEVVALLSGWNPHPTHPSAPTREHWIANNVYRWMPSVDVIHVNPGIFAFIYLLGLPAIVNFGILMAPFGQAMNAPPSNEDIGRVAAGVLDNPSPHIGKSFRPTGPRLISPDDMAAMLSNVVGRPVKYQNASFNMFAKAGSALGVSDFEIAQIRHYAKELSHGVFATGGPTDVVETITGQPAEGFESIARRYIAQPDLIRPGLTARTKLGASLFMLKMMLTRVPNFDALENRQGYPRISSPQLAHENPEWQASAEQSKLFLQSAPDTQTIAV